MTLSEEGDKPLLPGTVGVRRLDEKNLLPKANNRFSYNEKLSSTKSFLLNLKNKMIKNISKANVDWYSTDAITHSSL